MKKPRMYLSLGVLGAIVFFVLFVPLPQSVIAPLEIQARNAESVYVEVPGVLEAIEVVPGQQVEESQPLARLHSHDLLIGMERIEGTVARYQQRLESLRRQGLENPLALSERPQVEEALKSAEDQLRQHKEDMARLILKAPIAGTVLPPSYTPRVDDPDGQLPMWSGTPLDRENLGAHLDTRVLFCQVGDPRRLEAVLVIEQTDRSLVRKGQGVEIKIDELPHRTFSSSISDIAESELKEAPRRLSSKHGGEVSTKTDTDLGIERPMSTSYQADAPLDDATGVLRIGLRGTARIHTDPVPLGTRFWRFVSHTFNFKL